MIGEYLDEETETLVRSLQEAATKQWDRLARRVKGANMEQLGREMSRWWNRLRLAFTVDHHNQIAQRSDQ